MCAEVPPAAIQAPRPGDHVSSVATLEELFRFSFDPLVRMLSVLTDDAPDVVQDAFVEAYRHWDKIGAYDDPVMWIRRVAVNKARDRERRRGRERTAIFRVGPPRGDVATRAVVEGMDLRSAIRRLPNRQQLALVLFYIGDLTVEQVAAVMEISPGTVKASLHAARKNLVQLLEVPDDPG